MVKGLLALDVEEWTVHAATADGWAYLCEPDGAQLLNGAAATYESNAEGDAVTCARCLALLAAK
jgi:hypothetical protein